MKKTEKKRVAIVDKEKCNPSRCALECFNFCPINRTGAECITINEEKKIAVIDEDLCTGCGICVKKCPSHAITIVNLPYELEEPLHQYGRNSFRIYNIPVPRKGVVGLVGRNGIGKTTLLNILSGTLIPNLGNYEGKASWDKVLDKFKGHEVFSYLERIANKEARLSYKPQEVARIPRVFKGTVRELLEKTDETGKAMDFAEKLNVRDILNKMVDEISGGELQRVAVTAAMSKDAEFYFFDEPSSYLDIKQRLVMARVIKELSEDKSVIVVEHDLAVLDYLADYVHVLFGEPGAFGVVSSLKAARMGINEFLNGFLKNENVRIRDYSIRFEVKPPSEEWENKEKLKYNGFEKQYDDFRLVAEGGELVRGEVVGILGPNAIGKTTFVKVLAGVEKPTKGSIELREKVSYKPQYIEFNEDCTVREFIEKQDINFSFFNSEVKRIVGDLYEKKVNKLSGGEAQRLAIAIAVSKDSEILLLDEPSAFLDIEQRFSLSRLVKRVIEKKEVTTLCVDHDLVFQDLIANRIIVFEGVPGKEGRVGRPLSMRDGMNEFLKRMNITFRRDHETGRPRMNKPGSQMDEEQKKKGEYYYSLA